jgi:hypothetical protein
MWWGLAIIAVLFLFPATVGILRGGGNPWRDDPNAEHCVDWHRRNGQFRVLYTDGNFSQPFTWQVACDYRKIFGGRVVPKEAYEQAGKPVYP